MYGIDILIMCNYYTLSWRVLKLLLYLCMYVLTPVGGTVFLIVTYHGETRVSIELYYTCPSTKILAKFITILAFLGEV